MKIKLILIPLFMISCTNQSDDRLLKELYSHPDKPIVDLPVEYQDQSNAFLWKKERDTRAGVQAFQEHDHDIEIRINEDFVDRSGFILVLKYFDKKWSADSYKYEYRLDEESPQDWLIVKSKVFGENPKSGWDHLLTMLLKDDIQTLPHYKSFPGYIVNADDRNTSIEIFKKNFHRYYEYPNPYNNQSAVKEAKKMIQILKDVKQEFQCLR